MTATKQAGIEEGVGGGGGGVVGCKKEIDSIMHSLLYSLKRYISLERLELTTRHKAREKQKYIQEFGGWGGGG